MLAKFAAWMKVNEAGPNGLEIFIEEANDDAEDEEFIYDQIT